jgi:hypothetical protein
MSDLEPDNDRELASVDRETFNKAEKAFAAAKKLCYIPKDM